MQSPPTAPAIDRPARLRQSLPQPGSPSTGVCYHYSAQRLHIRICFLRGPLLYATRVIPHSSSQNSHVRSPIFGESVPPFSASSFTPMKLAPASSGA